MDIQTLKLRHLQARKEARTRPEAADTSAVLARVLGDVETAAKNRPGTPPLTRLAEVVGTQRAALEREVTDLGRLGRDPAEAVRQLVVLRALEAEITALREQERADREANQLSPEALRAAVEDAVAQGAANIGQVMAALKSSHPGRYDGATASRLAQAALKGL